MNILDTIVARKRKEIEEKRVFTKIADLQKSSFYDRPTFSLKQFLSDGDRTGIIAEFKRKSPSKGDINPKADVEKITAAYTREGASGLSVLTDEYFFGGSSEDLKKARINNIPILRKDFILDEYQVVEARAMGADAILLIAACLDPDAVRKLAIFAKSLHLEVLLEIHQKEELGHLCDEIDLVGVNNRDLKTFSVDINRSIELIRLIPAGKPGIAESGISDIATIQHLRAHGFRGFLIGENFMKEPDPAIAFASFVNQLKKGLHESKSLRHDTTGTGQEAR